jgi:hypothetical protein
LFDKCRQNTRVLNVGAGLQAERRDISPGTIRLMTLDYDRNCGDRSVMKKTPPTAEWLRSIVRYDRDTGLFTCLDASLRDHKGERMRVGQRFEVIETS